MPDLLHRIKDIDPNLGTDHSSPKEEGARENEEELEAACSSETIPGRVVVVGGCSVLVRAVAAAGSAAPLAAEARGKRSR